MTKTGTIGGKRLRLLRESLAKTQLEVELDASLGTGYLQRVESGKVQRPERETLERILVALGARYTERRDILELFGYVVSAPIPDEDEISWAVAACQAELAAAPFPAYLLDCAHRLLVWNALLPFMFQIEGVTYHRQAGYRVSMLRVLFDPKHGVAARITNPDVFFPASIRALRSEMQLFHDETWYNSLVGDMRIECHLFEKYWTMSIGQPVFSVAARPLAPLDLELPQGGAVQFRIMAEPFVQDRRFRVIYCLPATPMTMQKCIDWSRAAGSPPSAG